MPKRYCSFTVEYKISVIEWHQGNGSAMSKTANQFSIDRKCVRNWNAKYEELKRQKQLRKERKQERRTTDVNHEVYSLMTGNMTFCKRGGNFGLAVSNVVNYLSGG